MKNHLKNGVEIVKMLVIALIIIALGVYCRVVNFSLIIPMVLLFAGIQLFLFRRANTHLFINLSFLLALIVFTAYAVDAYTDLSHLFIPVASVGMLVMLLYNDLQLVFLMCLVSSILVTLVVGGNLSLMLTFFIGGLTGAYSIRGARTRSHLINSGFYIGLLQIICIILLFPRINFVVTKEFLLHYLRPLMINGFIASFIIMVSLKMFESLFGVLTNFSLLEMSDFNHPLLKRMVLKVPGTYHHSLIVSNLAEAGADAIGANALLCRVGGYYHDIGKMVKPEYFTENQMIDGNKHDSIEPSMSRLVILNHVKEGVELAKKYKLNPLIIDFIVQHHGTSLIYFFYQRALEEAKDEESVAEENFRYPGPKPQSRETAIVMLADSVEGATRSLDEPNPTKIEEVVRKIINNKFIDGQLDECNLTLKEIETTALTFTRVLTATYHSRVKYPEKKNGNGNTNSKSAEKDTSKPTQDNKNRKKDSSAGGDS